MKILSVLTVLAVFYRHSEGFKCQTIADFSGTVGALVLTEEDCAEEVTTCVRPKLVSGAYLTDDVKWGCGVCTTADNCISCAAENCNVEPSLECFTSVSAEAEAKDICDDGITNCKRPKIKVDGSYNVGDWGCGTCSDVNTCVECSASDCNVAPDQTYTCLKYEKSDDIWGKVTTAGNEHVTCYTEAGDGCNMPSPGNDAVSWVSCGDCVESTPTKCKECAAENCNDQDGEDVRYCHTGASAGESLVSQFCETATQCQRPFLVYGAAVSSDIEYKCGDCSEGDAENCVACSESNCNTPATDNTHQCFAWKWSAADSKWEAGDLKDCQAGDAEQKCSMPKKAEAEHKAEDLALEGCGPCADGKTEECTTTAAQQNKDVTHKCFPWTWSDDTKWGYSDTLINCYDGNDADSKKCSLPKDRSEKTGFSDDGVCAPCDPSDTEITNCLTSEPEKNSGRRVLFSLIALALPIFYTLL